MERFLGPAAARDPTEDPGHWAERLKEPWMTADYGDVRPRDGVSAACLRRVRWLVEEITTLIPVAKELPGWWAACAAIHQGGRGDWRAIETGIRRAWDRPLEKGRDYRPRHPAGFVGEVKLAYADAAGRRERQHGDGPTEQQLKDLQFLRARGEGTPG